MGVVQTWRAVGEPAPGALGLLLGLGQGLVMISMISGLVRQLRPFLPLHGMRDIGHFYQHCVELMMQPGALGTALLHGCVTTLRWRMRIGRRARPTKPAACGCPLGTAKRIVTSQRPAA